MLSERTAPSVKRVRAARIRPAALAAVLAVHWPLLLALGVVTFVALPTLNFAYGPDQALFAYIGEHLARGQTLYVDVWDVKPPGVFWIYALASALPGAYRGARAFDLLYTLVTVTAIYALGRLLWDRATGALAGIAYGVIYTTASGYWNMAQPDSFMVLPVTLAVLLWERGGREGHALRAAVLSGALFGLAFQFRAVVVTLPAVLALWTLWPRGERVNAVRRIAALGAGFVLVQTLTMAYLAAGGAVGEYLYAELRFARHYAALGGPYAFDSLTLQNYLGGLRGSVMFFLGSRLLITAPALAAVLIGGVLRADRGVRLAALLLLAAVAQVALQAKFFIYHWHITLPFLALLAGWTGRELWRALRDRFSTVRAGIAAAGVAGALLLVTPQVTDGGVGEWHDAVRYVVEPSYRSTYIDRFGLRGHGAYSFKASDEVSAYVRSRTEPGDTVFVWGYDPNLYLISSRDSASRFLSLLPLMPTFTPESWREEFVRDLAAKRPAYILLQRGENARWITGRPDDSYDWVRRFPAFDDLLTRSYDFEVRIEDYYLYRLRR